MDLANLLGIILFALIIAITMWAAYIASKRTSGTGDFYAAGVS